MWKKDASNGDREGGRPSFGDRGGRPSFGDRGGRPSFGGGRPSFGDRGGRPSFGDRGGRPSFGDRGPRSFGDRPADDSKKTEGVEGDRPSFGDRPRSFGGDRGGRPSFGDRPRSFGGDRGGRSFGGDRPRFDRGSRGGDASRNKPSHEVKFFLNDKVKAPKYMSQEATGADVFYSGPALKIAPGVITTIDTGIIPLELPERLECQVRGRSSLSSKGLLILDPTNFALDMKDSYLILTVINLSKEEITIEDGQAVAQLVFSFIQKVQINKTDELSTTKRNEGGFGSTDNSNSENEESSEENEEEAEA
jgi:deoxyuridine 5'-triphosphate nucleotidohydrolase